VVPMGMTYQKNLDVGELKPQRFDTGSNQRNVSFEVAVYEDVSPLNTLRMCRMVVFTFGLSVSESRSAAPLCPLPLAPRVHE
jgi:hypothetical protein